MKYKERSAQKAMSEIDKILQDDVDNITAVLQISCIVMEYKGEKIS